MKAVLFVGHGTRSKRGQAEFQCFTKAVESRVRELVDDVSCLFGSCYLELVGPDIVHGIDRLCHKGATDISLVPIFLFSAGHMKWDIPREMERAQHQHPEIRLNLLEAVGKDGALVRAAVSQLREEVRMDRTSLRDAPILLVGRGSTDQEAFADFESVRRTLELQLGDIKIEACFLTGLGTPFVDAMGSYGDSGVRQAYILPYLLFSGRLLDSIIRAAQQWEEMDSRRKAVVIPALGMHTLVIQRFAANVLAALHPQTEPICYEATGRKISTVVP